jgi:hypothetical protein
MMPIPTKKAIVPGRGCEPEAGPLPTPYMRPAATTLPANTMTSSTPANAKSAQGAAWVVASHVLPLHLVEGTTQAAPDYCFPWNSADPEHLLGDIRDWQDEGESN